MANNATWLGIDKDLDVPLRVLAVRVRRIRSRDNADDFDFARSLANAGDTWNQPTHARRNP
jgi:hypothetical protein